MGFPHQALLSLPRMFRRDGGAISERSEEWPGIETRVAVTRYYGEDGALAPHVVGYTGVITDTQYQQAVEDGTTYDAENNISGYKWSDTMGRSGIEPPLRRSSAASGERRPFIPIPAAEWRALP